VRLFYFFAPMLSQLESHHSFQMQKD
jgi:hypothetical protein